MNSGKDRSASISAGRIAAYASPALVTQLAWMPLGFVIVKFYAKYTALDLTTIGAIILIARLFDAVSDPIVAILSDTFETKWGRRKPWIVLSAPIAATGFALMFMPPADIHWSYFLVANITLYVGWTFFEITHIAWGLEVVREPGRRSQLGVILKVFAYIGSLLFFAFPFLFNPDPGSTEFTPPVMTALGLSIAVMFPVLALFSVAVVPQESRIGSEPFQLKSALKEIAGNRSFAIYASAFVLWALGDALLVALFIVFVDARLDLAAFEGVILLATYVSRLAFAPVVLVAMARYSHKTLWRAATFGNAAILPLMILFPAGDAALPAILAYGVILGLFDCAIGVLAITLLGDVIDRDAMTTGRDKAASYKASINLIEKSVRAAGASGGLMIVGTAGLVVGGDNAPFALLVLTGTVAVLPALLNLCSALVMGKYPLTAPTPIAVGLTEQNADAAPAGS